MLNTEIDIFLHKTFLRSESTWDQRNLTEIASILAPDIILGGRKTVLKADIKLLWAKWFIDGLCDPTSISFKNKKFAEIYYTIKNSLDAFNKINKDDKITIGKEIAKIILAESRQKKTAKRNNINIKTKEILLALYKSHPRCRICGYKFSDHKINSFLEKDNLTPKTEPLFIDYITMHGSSSLDTRIEVDHIIPISRGGGNNPDNLQLLCGWCNRHKSNFDNFYETSFYAKSFNHPKLGLVSTPRPLWVLRALASTQKCEHPNCNASNKETMLYAAPRYKEGMITPTNIKIFCREHDSLHERFIPNKNIKK